MYTFSSNSTVSNIFVTPVGRKKEIVNKEEKIINRGGQVLDKNSG